MLLPIDHLQDACPVKALKRFGIGVLSPVWASKRACPKVCRTLFGNFFKSFLLDAIQKTGFGPRFIVEGELTAADGRKTRIRTVWQFDRGEIAPRLITAYPSRQS